MTKHIAVIFFLLISFTSFSQKPDKLTVEKIMRDPKWIGTSPSNLSWSHDGQTLYFNWNPDNAPSDSTYFIELTNRNPRKASVAQKQNILTANSLGWNQSRTAYVYTKDGDIFFTDIRSGKTKRILQTTERETNPQFSFNETKIVYNSNQNLYAWDIATGETMQLTNITAPPPATGNQPPQQQGSGNRQFGNRTTEVNANTAQEQWLKNDQLQYFQVLKERKEKEIRLMPTTGIYQRQKSCERSILERRHCRD